MTKKRRFGISQSLNQGFSETISAAENNAGSVRFEVIALSRIETDPENPRHLILTVEDLRQRTFHESKDKQSEYEKLQSLAETIKLKGLMNPVVVYRYGEKYRLVAGERRFLASIIAGKEDIQARILATKPQAFDLRLLQWIENTEREDLSLKERIGNIKAIIDEYRKEKEEAEITPTLLKELIGISFSQASCYISILQASADIVKSICDGAVNNIDKAAFIAKIKSPELRQKALDACINGNSLKQLRHIVENESRVHQETSRKMTSKLGRAPQRVNMGATSKLIVIKKIIQVVTQQAEYRGHSKHFEGIDWNNYAQTTQAFKKFINLLENEVGSP